MIGIMALGLLLAAVFAAPAYGRLVSSAQTFRQHFRNLNHGGNSLNPIERLVFSLVMADSRLGNGHSVQPPMPESHQDRA